MVVDCRACGPHAVKSALKSLLEVPIAVRVAKKMRKGEVNA